MKIGQLASAVEQWTKDLDAGRVRADDESLDRYRRNAGEVSRAIAAVVWPMSTEEVAKVVLTANRFRAPLYPVSCGRNWGLGSRLPVTDGAVIVDLSRMDRIREVNVPHRYAVVEPGVTQRHLYHRIKAGGLPLVLNVTGAAADTSLIGNALERGIGYFASRADSLSGMEVVLGSGRVIRTGFGHFAGAKTAYLCRHGIGPSLDGLFAESAFGIVTAAGFELMPETESHAVMISKIARADLLPAFMDALADLRRRHVVNTVVHVGNRNRTESVLAPLLARRMRPDAEWSDPELRHGIAALLDAEGFGPWSAVGGIMGTRGQVALARREIRAALKGLAKTVFLNDTLVGAARALGRAFRFVPAVRKKENLLLAVEPLYSLARGIPTDAAMTGVYWPVGEKPRSDDQNPDDSRSGLLFCVPMLPAEGAVSRDAVCRVEEIYGKHGFAPLITLNMADDRSVEMVINLAFDRDDAARVKAAHACNDELTAAFVRDGLIPYRVGIQSMAQVVDKADPFWQTVRDLKGSLDPNGIIAPGRYCP